MKKINYLMFLGFLLAFTSYAQTPLNVNATGIPSSLNYCQNYTVHFELTNYVSGQPIVISENLDYLQCLNVSNAAFTDVGANFELMPTGSGPITFDYVSQASCITEAQPVHRTIDLQQGSGNFQTDFTYSLINRPNPQLTNPTAYSEITLNGRGTITGRNVPIGTTVNGPQHFLILEETFNIGVEHTNTGLNIIRNAVNTTIFSYTQNPGSAILVLQVTGVYSFEYTPLYQAITSTCINTTAVDYANCSLKMSTSCSENIEPGCPEISTVPSRIVFKPRKANIQFTESSPTLGACRLGGNHKRIVTVTNTGAAAAEEVEVSILNNLDPSITYGNRSYIDQNSVKFTLNGHLVTTPELDINLAQVYNENGALNLNVPPLPSPTPAASGLRRTALDYTTRDITHGTFVRLPQLAPNDVLIIEFDLVLGCMEGTFPTRVIESDGSIRNYEHYEVWKPSIEVVGRLVECSDVVESKLTELSSISTRRLTTYPNCQKTDIAGAPDPEHFTARMSYSGAQDISFDLLGSHSNQYQIVLQLLLQDGLLAESTDPLMYAVGSYLIRPSVLASTPGPISVGGITYDSQLMATFTPNDLPPGFTLENLLNVDVELRAALFARCTSLDRSRYTIRTILQKIDANCPCPSIVLSSGFCEVKVRCPGCKNPGTNINLFSVRRITKGWTDADNNGLHENTLSPPDAAIALNRISNGDELEFSTTIGLSDGEPGLYVPGSPATTPGGGSGATFQQLRTAGINLDHLYYTSTIPSGSLMQVQSSVLEIFQRNSGGGFTLLRTLNGQELAPGVDPNAVFTYMTDVISGGNCRDFNGNTIPCGMGSTRRINYYINSGLLSGLLTNQFNEDLRFVIRTRTVLDQDISVAAPRYLEADIENYAFLTGNALIDRFKKDLVDASITTDLFSANQQYWCEQYDGRLNYVIYTKSYSANESQGAGGCSRAAKLSRQIKFPTNLRQFYPYEFREFFPLESVSIDVGSNYRLTGAYQMVTNFPNMYITMPCWAVGTIGNFPPGSSHTLNITPSFYSVPGNCNSWGGLSTNKLAHVDEGNETFVTFIYDPVCNDINRPDDVSKFKWSVVEQGNPTPITTGFYSDLDSGPYTKKAYKADLDIVGTVSLQAFASNVTTTDPIIVRNISDVNIFPGGNQSGFAVTLNAYNSFLFFPDDRLAVTEIRSGSNTLSGLHVSGGYLYFIGTLNAQHNAGPHEYEFTITNAHFTCDNTMTLGANFPINVSYGWACSAVDVNNFFAGLTALPNCFTIETETITIFANNTQYQFTSQLLDADGITPITSLTAGCHDVVLSLEVESQSIGSILNLGFDVDPGNFEYCNLIPTARVLVDGVFRADYDIVGNHIDLTDIGEISSRNPSRITALICLSGTCLQIGNSSSRSTLTGTAYCGRSLEDGNLVDFGNLNDDDELQTINIVSPIEPTLSLQTFGVADPISNCVPNSGIAGIVVRNNGPIRTRPGFIIIQKSDLTDQDFNLFLPTMWTDLGTAIRFDIPEIDPGLEFVALLEYTSNQSIPGTYHIPYTIFQSFILCESVFCEQDLAVSTGILDITVEPFQQPELAIDVEWCSQGYPVYTLTPSVPGTYNWTYTDENLVDYPINASDVSGDGLSFTYNFHDLDYLPYPATTWAISVSGTTADGCPVSVTTGQQFKPMEVNCCQQEFDVTFNGSNIGNIIVGNTFVGGRIHVTQDITLSGGTFNISSLTELYFDAGIRLIVRDGANLNIRGALLTSTCSSDKWGGILMNRAGLPNSPLYSLDIMDAASNGTGQRSEISNAVIGINMDQASSTYSHRIRVQFTDFINNEVGIQGELDSRYQANLPFNTGFQPRSSLISDNHFFLFGYRTNSARPVCGIRILRGDYTRTEISRNRFDDYNIHARNSGTSSCYGILAGDLNAEGSSAVGINVIQENRFDECDFPIVVRNNGAMTSISHLLNSRISNSFVGISYSGVSNSANPGRVNINDNIINESAYVAGSIGINIEVRDQSLVNNNQISFKEWGVVARYTSLNVKRVMLVQGNEFQNNLRGVWIRDAGLNPNNRTLIFNRCNEFSSSDPLSIGIDVEANVRLTGQNNGGNNEAGNVFLLAGCDLRNNSAISFNYFDADATHPTICPGSPISFPTALEFACPVTGNKSLAHSDQVDNDLSALPEGIEVFPNPANDQLTIRIVNNSDEPIDSLTVLLYDATGKLILERIQNSNELILDVSNLSNGFYNCKVNGESIKLVISK